MISLDTNVLIRYVVRDELAQYRLASDLINRSTAEGQAALATLLVMMETEWVLRSAYRYSKPQILAIFDGLLTSGDLRIENEIVLEQALRFWSTRAVSFANCLILANSLALGCSEMFTFDKSASKLPGATLLRKKISTS
jgi:predicted nucleic-acid-binding protein